MWHDLWSGEFVLKEGAPSLFGLALDREEVVADWMEGVEGERLQGRGDGGVDRLLGLEG